MGAPRENGIDLTNAAILATDTQTDLRRNNGAALAWYWARQSLILRAWRAGGTIDDTAAKALSLDWMMAFLVGPSPPRSCTAAGRPCRSRSGRPSTGRTRNCWRGFSLWRWCSRGREPMLAPRRLRSRGNRVRRLAHPHLIEALENAGLRLAPWRRSTPISMFFPART